LPATAAMRRSTPAASRSRLVRPWHARSAGAMGRLGTSSRWPRRRVRRASPFGSAVRFT